MNQKEIEFDFRPAAGTVRLLKALTAAGALTMLAGAAVAPDRIWPALLLASYLVLGLGLAGIFFVALQYASGAGWSVAFRRVPEAMAATLPYGAAGMALVLVLRSSLYPWTGDIELHGAFKHFWLNLGFFLGRAAVYLTIWLLFTALIVGTSRLQDRDGNVSHTRRNVKLSIGFLVLFAVTFWLASYDWIMSLEPEWYSTIFGVYHFAGLFSSGLAMLILLVLWLRRTGPLRDFVNQEHLHDLGKLLFGFSTFWMYIWFSQYMLIWYANMTEETGYYIRRMEQFWQPLFVLNVVLNWVAPFVVLLSRAAKRNPGILAKVAVVVLAGRVLDLYLMIAPPLSGGAPRVGIWEAGLLAGAVAVFLLVFLKAIRQAPVVPLRDPYLAESLHYHN
jgi:hypothetical protein